MPRPRDPNKGMVVAREAVVVIVGARAKTYERITVTHNKTGQEVEMDSDRIDDPGSEGMSYAFKQYQRVHRNHDAVKTSPGSFMPIEDLDDAELELVTS